MSARPPSSRMVIRFTPCLFASGASATRRCLWRAGAPALNFGKVVEGRNFYRGLNHNDLLMGIVADGPRSYDSDPCSRFAFLLDYAINCRL